jgi:hypothetical protein
MAPLREFFNLLGKGAMPHRRKKIIRGNYLILSAESAFIRG